MGAADEKVEDGKLGLSAGSAAPDVADATAPDAERASAEAVADGVGQASSDAPEAGALADPARDVTLEGLELEAERLTNPKRSLFEQTDPTLAGVHRGSALSLITGAASGLGVAFGVSLVAVARMLAGGGIEEVPEVIAIGGFALTAQCVALFFQPLSVCANMLFQSTGQSTSATFLSSLRQGLYYLPLMLVLPLVIGLRGVQIAQPLADVLTFITSVPFLVRFFAQLPRQDRK